MMQMAVHGRLGGDPKEITTRTGTTMAVDTIAVKLNTRSEEQETEWLGLVAFAKTAEALLRHKRGDMLSASGRVQGDDIELCHTEPGSIPLGQQIKAAKQSVT
jgi:single-strand DNA-binding protein